MYDDKIPEWTQKQIDSAVDGAKEHIKMAAGTAWRLGVSHGRHAERDELIKRLREYEKDSVVAKLLAEMIERESWT